MTPEARCTLTLLLLTLLSPPSRCQPESLELVPGDVTLGAIFSVNNIQGDHDCGDYDIDTLKGLVAAQWFLQAINNMSYIPGVQLGLEAYRTCQSGERATQNTVHMLETFNVLEENSQDINTTQPLLGILGPGRTQEAIVVSRFLSSLPSSQRPLLISGSATGAVLKDKAIYSNFFRVIPPDSTQVQVLQKLLVQLGWNYISIVYDDDAYGSEAARQLRDLAQAEDLCVPSFAALPLDYRSQTFITATDTIIDRLRGGDSSIITGVVFIGSAATAKEFLGRLSLRVTFVRFIFSEAVGLQTSVVSGTTLGKGALAAAPPYLPLPEFRLFWNNLWANRGKFLPEMQRNQWLANYYTKKTGCLLSDDNCWTQALGSLPLIHDDTQWLFEYYQVKATAIFAVLLKQLHSDVCGQGFSGVCLQLKQVLRNNRERFQELVESSSVNLEAEFSSVSSIFRNETLVGFDERGEITSGGPDSSLYDVFNYRECDDRNSFCFLKVGTYSVGGVLHLDTERLRGYTDSGSALSWPNFPKSQCMVGHDCSACIPSDLTSQFIFVPGDIYIVAIGPVHEKLSNQPLKCGDIRTSAGADMVHSVLFAVEEVNKKRNAFTGIFGAAKLGVLIFNSCSRELVINERLISLHKGTLTLPDGRNSSAILPYIAGYVGAYFSTVSVTVYEILSSLDTRFVMLSPSNTSPELSDRFKYPLYLRLPSGEDSQVRGLLTLVRDLGHQYVQVIYDPDDIYTLAIKESLNALSSQKSFNICIVNNIVSDDEGTNFYSVLDDLRKNDWASLVIVVLQSEHIRNVMKDILPLMTSSDHFRFLAPDGWARGSDILSVPKATRLLGTLTLSTELPLNQLFKEYLRNTDPLTTINPWLKYFWEARKQCYFDSSFQRKDKTGVCPADLTNGYVQDTWIPFYIDAIYVFALGLNSAMLTRCGQISLCETLTSQKLVESIREVRFDLSSTGVPVNVFDENGDGEVGFKIFQVAFDTSTSDPDDVTYVEVGRYERDALTLFRENLWILSNLDKTVCPNSKACNACFPVPPVSPNGNNNNQDDGISNAVIGTVVVIVILIIAIVALIVVLIIACRRLKTLRERRSQEEKFAFDNLSGPRSGDARPPLPIRDGSAAYDASMGSGSGGRQSPPNAYDYLDSVGPARSVARSSHAYLAQGQAPRGTSAGSSAGSSVRTPSLTSAGYVSRESDGRPSYERTNPPYDISTNRAPPVSHSPGGGSQSSGLPRDWRPEEGGQQYNHLDDWQRQEGGRQNSLVADSRDSDGTLPLRPVKFENNDSGLARPHPPEPCRSSINSGYLTPLRDDSLTPREDSLTPKDDYLEPADDYLTPRDNYQAPADDCLTPRPTELTEV